MVLSGRMTDNGHNYKDMFRLDKGKPPPHDDSQALKQGSREAVQSPTLEVFKTCPEQPGLISYLTLLA